MKLIPLNTVRKSKIPNAPTYAMVDDEDYDYLMQYKWCAHKTKTCEAFYAIRGVHNGRSMSKVFMHREVMNTPIKFLCDHKDRNGLNNQKSNLRNATRSQNNANRKSQKNSTSKYLGVHWHKCTGKWLSKIGQVHLGVFKNEIDAAKAYDEAAKKYHGEFANLNFK